MYIPQAIKDTAMSDEAYAAAGPGGGERADKFCFASESCLPASLPGPALAAIGADHNRWLGRHDTG